jgi:NTP pyrophosphatase (non-canonical NTP hydrolase)
VSDMDPNSPAVDPRWGHIRDVADYINAWANHAFPGRAPKAALTKLVMEEIPELLTHLKTEGERGIGQELADCFILLMDLAVIWKVDLPNAIRYKMAMNETRQWTKDAETGHYQHIEPAGWQNWDEKQR